MTDKIRLAFASAVAALLMAVGLGLTAAPAQAAALHGCADNSICLYQWTNYGASKWQSSFFNLQNAGCINLTSPAAYWASDGAQVWDNSGSMVVNATGSWSGMQGLAVYDWANCLGQGPGNVGFSSYPIHLDTAIPNLTTVNMGNGYSAYHRITSIKFLQN